MNNIQKEIYNNSLSFYFNLLPHYGIDRYNTKKDLLLLSMIDDLLENDCHYGLIEQKTLGYIKRFVHSILDKNPILKYCRINLNQYNNLGDTQNIEKFQVIEKVINRFKE